MATLTDSLIVQVAADISAFKKDMASVKDEMLKTAAGSKKVGDETEKATKKASGGFKSMKADVMAVRSSLLLVVAAAVAISAPFLQAEDAMKEFSAVAKSSGKPFQDLEKNTRKAADESGQSIATFADTAKKAMNQYGLAANTSLAATKAAFNAAKLGIFTYEEGIQALAPILTRFKISNVEAEDALALIKTTAEQTGQSIGSMSGLLVALAPKAKKAGIDLLELASSIVMLERRGVAGDQAIDAIAGTLDQLGKKKPFDGVDPWAVYYSGLGAAASGSDALGKSLEILFESASAGNSALVASVTGSADLAAAFEDGAENGFMFASAVSVVNKGIEAMPAIIYEANGKLDEMAELANKAKNALTGMGKAQWKYSPENQGAPIGAGFASGGQVPGSGSGDTVPAMLTPGEFVIKKDIAQHLMPFLSKLNAGGIDLRNLWTTVISKAQIGGKSVLADMLSIPNDLGIRRPGSSVPSIQAEQNKLMAEVVSGMRGVLGFAGGGRVPNQAPSNSTSIGSVNVNVSGADLANAAGRRQFVSLVERESRAGRSPTRRSGR